MVIKHIIEGVCKSAVSQTHTIVLPSTYIKIKELSVSKPLTIQGHPETVLEVTHGSIMVDFAKN